MKKKIGIFLTLAAVMLFLGTALFAQATKPLNVALPGNPETLDPQVTSSTLTFQVVRSIYDTLAEPDKNGNIVPALAEKWTTSADSLMWTFTLRKGVVFHNGDKLTSKDVKATFDRIRDTATASPKASEFKSITAIETPDDYTVVFKLAEPYAPFLSALASGWGAILPKSQIDAKQNIGNQPIGTGPYKLKEWVRDNRIVLEKNASYWMKGFPKTDRVNIQIIPEQAVMLQGLLTGDLDVIYPINDTDIPVIERNSSTTVDKTMSSMVLVLAMNCSKAPLDNLKVRQAVNHAIDKQKVIDIAYAGGKPVGTFMDLSDPYYKDFTSLYPFNQDRARQLLRESGMDTGKALEMVIPQNYELHVKAGQIYQEMLTKVGLKVNIKLVDWSTWMSDVYRGGKYDFTVIGHTGKLDPDGRLAGYGTDKTYVKWVNPRAAELIDTAKKTIGFENRKKIYDEALEIMAKEVPFVFTGTSYRFIGLRKNISGLIMDTKLDTYDFRYTEKK